MLETSAQHAEAVLILDELCAQPAHRDAIRGLIANEYMPDANRRGMALSGAWETPVPLGGTFPSVTLYYLWSVADPRAWWAMRLSRLPDGADEREIKQSFWQRVDRLCLSRRRSVLTPQPAVPPCS